MVNFNIETVNVDDKEIRCAFLEGISGKRLTTMAGGIPQDPERRARLPLINKLYGHLAVKLSSFDESSLLYNQPGTGGSGGDWNKETLESKTKVLIDITKYFADRSSIQDISLVGTSAAGCMSLNAIESLQLQGLSVSKLVLISPAAYPDSIDNLPYGKEFSELIREPWNISDSPAFAKLENYIKKGGSARITFFEVDDPPIPKEIQDYYRSLARTLADEGGDISVDIIPGVSHNFRRINSAESKNIVDNDSIRQTATSFIDFLENK